MKTRFLKLLFILLGSLSLAVGALGVIVPGLPTTPFLLLTAALYIRGSDRLYKKLIENKFFGSYIKEFRSKKGMTLKEKIRSLTLMWVMISISCIFLIDSVAYKLFVIGVGILGTIVMGFIIKTVKVNTE